MVGPGISCCLNLSVTWTSIFFPPFRIRSRQELALRAEFRGSLVESKFSFRRKFGIMRNSAEFQLIPDFRPGKIRNYAEFRGVPVDSGFSSRRKFGIMRNSAEFWLIPVVSARTPLRLENHSKTKTCWISARFWILIFRVRAIPDFRVQRGRSHAVSLSVGLHFVFEVSTQVEAANSCPSGLLCTFVLSNH